MKRTRGRRGRNERGQVSVLIVGLSVVLIAAFATIVDVSAAYLQRSSLNGIADGAALAGADAAVQGDLVYTGGLDDERLELVRANVARTVNIYLTETGAYADYPGLRERVSIDPVMQRVRVRVTAPLDLPIPVGGIAGPTSIEAEGAASVFTGN